MSTNKTKSGRLDIITGPMCSGKTGELIRRLHRATAANLNVLYINHRSDTRSDSYSTHNPFYKEKISKQTNITFMKLDSLGIIPNIDSFDIIGIDEAQFFSDLFGTVLYLVEKKNKHLIISGLTNDFKRDRFGSILDLEPYSDSFTKLTAFCKNCAKEKKQINALFSHRMSRSISDQISVGGMNEYIPLCRKCYIDLNRSK